MSKGPDFICIGAQKAGTSWLHYNLIRHPQTLMPPTKEVNFFVTVPGEKIALINKWLNPRMWLGNWRSVKKSNNNAQVLPWFINYFTWYKQSVFASKTIDDYIQLFPKQQGKITGDISPSYADLSEQQIKELSIALPNVKLIYLIRNPIERAWSQFKMDNPKILDIHKLNTEMIERVKISTSACYHSQYSHMLQKWEKYFPGQVNVWFYDQLCEDPFELLTEICTYLGIQSPDETFREKAKEEIFKGPDFNIPDELHTHFIQTLRDEVKYLHARFNNQYTSNWLTLYEALLA